MFEGERYILAQGPTLPAGAALAVTVSGLPHHSAWPRRIALALAVLMLGAGFWAAGRRPTPAANAARVKQLSGKREKIYAELVRLEQQRRAGGIDAAKYAERRPALMAQLERVYRDLDTEGGQAPSRERRLPRSLHPRAQPELRAPPRVIARIARLPRRRDRRPARAERRGQINAPGHPVDARRRLVGIRAVRRPHGAETSARLCDRASASCRTTSISTPSSPRSRTWSFSAGSTASPTHETVAADALRRARLDERGGDVISGFSRGMRQRLALERALLHDPRLLLLDEPFTGLDDASTLALIGRLRELRSAGCIMLVATHDLDVGEAVFDRAVILHDGRLIASEADVRDLRKRYQDRLQAGAAS